MREHEKNKVFKLNDYVLFYRSEVQTLRNRDESTITASEMMNFMLKTGTKLGSQKI